MIKKVLTKAFQKVPESLRFPLLRLLARVPELALNQNFRIEIAQSKEDLECAFKLLHDCYVGKGLMKPHQTGMRCNMFTFLPHSTIVVVKLHEIVVGTVSLIRDSKCGLPSDKDFLNENENLRHVNKNLVEVSALAVCPEFRKQGNAISLLLMKYLYNYCKDFFQSDCLVCTVHPRAEDFYKSLWNFKRNGDVVKYQFAGGALAVHLSMTLSEDSERHIVRSYGSQTKRRNLALFVLEKDSRFVFPKRENGEQIDPVMSLESFQYFCFEKAATWFELSDREKSILVSIYRQYKSKTTKLLAQHFVNQSHLQIHQDVQIQRPVQRDYRFPTNVFSIIQDENNSQFAKIKDISSGGAFVQWNSQHAPPKGQFRITLKIKNQTFQAVAEVAWINSHPKDHSTCGFGIRFIDKKQHQIVNFIQNVYSCVAA